MKTALVTGVTSGVGLEIGRTLLAKGWRVLGVARGRERLAALRSEFGPNFVPVVADVSNLASMTAAFKQIKESCSQIDALINNAAVFKMGAFSEFDASTIDSIIDTNLKGTIYCTSLALQMITRGSGRIINIGSVAGTHGIKNQAVYCASKYGVDGFSEALGQELASLGISITTICPGGIDTPLWNDTNPYPGGDKNPLLKPKDLALMVDQIVSLPSNVIMKKVITFPSNEWH